MKTISANLESILIQKNRILFQSKNLNNKCEADCSRYFDLLEKSLTTRNPGSSYELSSPEIVSGVNLTLFNADYAILDIFRSDTEYRKLIGDSSISLVNRAKRNGCTFKKINPRDHDEDIRSVLVSDPNRSGRNVPPEWFETDYKLPLWEKNLCKKHKEEAFGVFHKEKLIAICTLRFFWEIASINFIVGHSEHLDFGIMYFLLYELRIYLKNQRPDVSYLHYTHMGAPHYANYYHFKKGTGFLDTSICFVDSIEVASLLKKISQSEFHKETDNDKIKYNKKNNPKLFKQKPEINEGNDIKSISNHFFDVFLKKWSVISKLKFDDAKNDKAVLFTQKNIEYFIENLGFSCLFNESIFNKNSRIIIAGVQLNRFKEIREILKDKLSGNLYRGELVLLAVLNNNFEKIDNLKMIDSFKNSQLQFLAARNFFHNKYEGVFFILAKI